METKPTRDGWHVRFRDGVFLVAHPQGHLEVAVITPVEVTTGFEGMEFTLDAFAKRDLKENATYPVLLRGGTGSGTPRIGLMVPANALGSVEHSQAAETYFRDYSYVAIKLALEYLSRVSPHVLEAFVDQPEPVLFSDLFDDNQSFLVLSCSKIPQQSAFSIDRIMPSLVDYGYVPTHFCKPSELAWAGSPPQAKNIKVSLISEDLDNPQMLSKLLILSATSSPSLVTQFFYLYQVFEYLMESVMRHRLPLVMKNMIRSLESGTASAKDQFDALGDEIREKGRLKLLVRDYSHCQADLDEFSLASQDFLSSLNITSSPGIDAVYKVRNFLFHQARNLESHDDPLLKKVVEAFSQYLPKLLETYKNPASPEDPSVDVARGQVVEGVPPET
jgi:hypothetical protein